MAPRGRPKKVGQKRIDAAIAQVTPLGFTESQIQRKVKALLGVYDGEWKFIEESSYQVLIDALLEEQEEERLKKDNKAIEDGGGPSSGHDDAEPSSAWTANEVMVSISTDHKTSKYVNGRADEVLASISNDSETAKDVNRRETTCVSEARGRLEWRDISCMENDSPHKMVTVEAKVATVPKRKPCYGWIGSDDEDDCVFFVTEASRRYEMNRNRASRKVRLSRWDVKL